MNSTDIPAPTLPVTENKGMQFDEIRKASFWVGQFFIIIATVLGVYLASTQGFKQAMAYGNLQSARSNYYLRKSLRTEMHDNIALVREYMKRLETGGLPARKAPFSLDTFVWESMKNATATMETPPEMLREARMFYRGVADLHQKIVDNTYGVKVANEKLTEMLDHVEKTVLPMFDADIAKVGKYLQDNGLTVE